MATNTYVALKTTTVTGSAVSDVTLDLTGISEYTDLVVAAQVIPTAGCTGYFRVNGSTSSIYSDTWFVGYGSGSPSSYRDIAQNKCLIGDMTGTTTVIMQLQNYANTNIYKRIITRSSSTGNGVTASSGLFSSTSAITSITLIPNSTTWAVGSTFTVYGIAAEGALAKATGGAIYSDSQYWYHAFANSGTFTPTQSLTADILVVAGGGAAYNGASSGENCGGGGAGGVLAHSAQSLSATGYTVTVGAGGSIGSNGTNSSFGGLTASVGGGVSGIGSAAAGASGGSGGGGGNNTNGGAATSGQGFAGGNGSSNTASAYGAGGGGGAGAVGSLGTGSAGGAGGVGTSAYNTWSLATGAGELVAGTYYFAGGGGGSSNVARGAGGYGGGGQGQDSTATGHLPGKPNTGGGGGGGRANQIGGTGGSGIVIVRYAK